MITMTFRGFEDAHTLTTFPTEKQFTNMKVGDLVKVCHSGEMFWAKIINIRDDEISATVENSLVLAPFDLNEVITFNKNNIFLFYGEVD